jgi:FKBP-type peptidyl-prolyl cis-trans isomerase (trigger factor)
MKEVSEYRKSVTIYLVPNFRSGNTLKVEFTVPFANAVFSDVLKELRKLGFSCAELSSSSSQKSNIIDISLDLCVDEREVAQDLFAYLETVLGKNEVINRIITKAKTK